MKRDLKGLQHTARKSVIADKIPKTIEDPKKH